MKEFKQLLRENDLKLKRLLTIPIVIAAVCLNAFQSQGQTVIKDLYLSDPAQALDRIDPVNTGDATTAYGPKLSTAAAGVVVDATTTGYSNNPNSTTFTVSHTTGTGDNRLMLVGISEKNKLVSSVTYGGVPLTLVGESITNGNARVHLFMLIAPASGTANVVVTLSANPDKGIVVGVTSFTGVHQTTPLGTWAGATNKSTTASVSIPSAVGELVYDVATYRNTAMSAAAGQTPLYNINSGGEIDGGGASTKPGAASVTMSWTGSDQDWAIGGVSIKPAPAIVYTTFTQSPALCSALTIKSGNTITLTNYVNVTSGTMPANPNITANVKIGSNTIISLTAPSYNSGTGILTWTGSLVTDYTVAAAQAIILEITTSQAGVTFQVLYDSQTKPSKLSLPVSTFINVNSVGVYTAPYTGGIPVNTSLGGTTKYLRAIVSDPFGTSDITSLNFTITPGSTVAGTSVATLGCTKIFEYAWSVPAVAGTYNINAVAKEGYENTVTHSKNTSIDVCVNCPPSAVADSASGPGGVPVTINALSNDSDPNNNINSSSLTIQTQPSNGSAYISNGKVVYVPNGTFSGRDTITYRVCDLSAPTPLCATAQIYVTIAATTVDGCTAASQTHTYFIPFPEQDAYTALQAASSITFSSNQVRTVISIKIPYPGVKIIWDESEDGYETNCYSPTQSTTKTWGDGILWNGVAPGYVTDIIPAGGSIILDNTIPVNPRNNANIFYDGRDKIVASAQIAMTQVSGEPTWIGLQSMKTNITSGYDFGQSFTVPFGQNFNSQDFAYTALFIRAEEDNTTINIDKDNNGTFETIATINQGANYLVNGGVMTGALVTSDKPVGVEVCSGGIDAFSFRNIPVFPATWYSNTYYTPVPTSDISTDSPKDSSVVMLYNSLNRAISINWSSGVPASGTINLPAKTAVRFPLAYSTTAAYKFYNPTGESFVASEIIDSYTPGGGGNVGTEFDWSFNLISESRLTDYATIAWAPGSTNGTRNDNPLWVTPIANTTIYVKYDGDLSNGGSVSPCGLRYDVSYALNALNYRKLLDPNDNDNGGMAVYTCNGVKLAAVYGEDPASATIANPSWDVGSTIQPFCKDKMILANDDYAETPINQPVTISILKNDYGFQATIDPATVNIVGLLQASHGTVTVNSNGTVLYTPNNGYVGLDTFEYQVCSTPTPVKCDIALVIVKIASCPAGSTTNLISGTAFIDKSKDGINNDDGTPITAAKVYLYSDGNCNGIIDANELTDSVTVDQSGTYQFVRYPEKIISDNFDATGGTSSCASGTDGNTGWLTNWVDAGEGGSTGYCVTPVQSAGNTDAEIILDGAFSYALRLDDNNVSATRTFNSSGATKMFLTFSYRRASASLAATEDVYVQLSTDGTNFTTIYTIAGNGLTDASYVTIYNQDITVYAGAATYLRFLTNNNVDDADYVFFDDIKVQFLKYNQCYITKLATSSIPANYNLTTASQYAITFTSAGNCATVKDFGVAKASISISGTVNHDANGLNDSQINGAGFGDPEGTTLYAYLVDSTGKVAFKQTVNVANGQFSFTNADTYTTYSVRISTTSVAAYADAPSSAGLPGYWRSMGEEYGTNNGAGSGIKAGTPNSFVPVITGNTNINNIKIGIEKEPDSDNKIHAVAHPFIGQYFTLNGGSNPPVLSGIDVEDCQNGATLSNKTVIIDAYPDNADLYYNSVLVTDGQQITNFNANLLQIKITNATIGDSTVTFLYSYVDVGSVKDGTPATYTIYWPSLLPVTGLQLSAKLEESTTQLSWTTYTEQNTSHFILERSADNIHFSIVSDHIRAAGESHYQKDYTYFDPLPAVSGEQVFYYRVKIVDLDGQSKTSNVASVKLKSSNGLSVWPNPFQSDITINSRADRDCQYLIELHDASGRLVTRTVKEMKRGSSQFTLQDLGRLPKGMYLLKVSEQNSQAKTVYKMIKSE